MDKSKLSRLSLVLGAAALSAVFSVAPMQSAHAQRFRGGYGFGVFGFGLGTGLLAGGYYGGYYPGYYGATMAICGLIT